MWLVRFMTIVEASEKINLSPYASWNQTGVTIAGHQNGTAGSHPSQLNHPSSLSISRNDVMYISDLHNHRIIVVCLNFTDDSFAIGSRSGSNSSEFNYPYSVFATNTSLYVSEYGNSRVQKMSLNGSDPVTVSRYNISDNPTYLFVVNDTDIYVTYPSKHSVLLFHSNSTNFSIVAGNGSEGSDNTQLNHPYGVFVNDVGTIYVADCRNHRIMKWLPGACFGLRAAGYGKAGNSPTQLSCPTQIIVDANEYMYISEGNNHRITRWKSNLTFGECIAACTGAHGIASNQLQSPHSLAMDSSGSLYINDYGNHRVQKFQILNYQMEISLSPQAVWNQTANTITGWVNGTNGSSLSQLNEPFDISISSNNVLYISDKKNHRIVVVQLDSPTNISIIGLGPGFNSNQLNKPHDLFVINTSLYVIDLGNRRVQKTSLDGSDLTTVPVLFNLPWALYLFVGNNRDIYLSETERHRVLLFRLNSANILIVAGNGTQGSNNNQLKNPYGVFVSQIGTIYIADNFNHRIMKWLPGASFGSMVAGTGGPGSRSTQLNHPTQVIIDTNEYMYISEAGNHRITRWEPNSNFGVCIAACIGEHGTASTQLNDPHSLTIDSNGSLYVSDHLNYRVQKFQILNYQTVSYNQPTFSRCASWNARAITITNINTINLKLFGIFVNSTYTNSSSIFTTLNGDNYGDNNHFKHRINTWTMNSTINLAIINNISSCTNLFIDLANNLYCSKEQEHQVIKFSINNDLVSTKTVAGNGTNETTPYLLSFPNGIFVDGSLNLYVADSGNDRIQLFRCGEMNATTVAGNKALGTNIGLNFPTGVVLDDDGYLFIADRDNDRIIRSELNGFRCIVGCSRYNSPSDQLDKPRTLWFDKYGHMFVIEKMNNRIKKFLLTTNSCDESSSSSLTALTCWNLKRIGFDCNISSAVCDMLQPCKNHGTCNNIDGDPGYNCSCPIRFNGTLCEFDHRPCKNYTCWNNGTCNETSDTTFNCTCTDGWEGIHCETKTDYCYNITCENQGVCYPLFLNYSCECLADSYFGRHCEITATKIIIYKIVSKSFAYIAIIALISVAIFVIIMDILKYCFGIDPVSEERERIRRKQRAKKRKPVIQRFIYVNAPLPTEEPISPIQETAA